MSELTVFSALKAQVQYPLPVDFFSYVIEKRGLTGGSTFTKEVDESAEFRGARADCIRQVLLYPSSISEGGMSISKASREDLLNEANRLYRSIGEEPIDERPKITCY
jgi:hypothetical protein